MRNAWWIVVVVILIVGGLAFVGLMPQTQVPTDTGRSIEGQGGSSPSQATVKEFTVVGKPFSFTPNEIRVNKGDTVRITFNNMEGFHDFTIDGYNVKTKQIQAGQSDMVEFVADKAGTFEFFCGVGTHREMGMIGKLIVE